MLKVEGDAREPIVMDPPFCQKIESSMAVMFTADSAAALAWLGQRGATILAARVDGAKWHTQADYRGATAIVLGSEAAGLSDVWSGESVTAIKLPMLGAGDSLNVSATAAVLFYEALRQRGDATAVDRAC